VDTSRFRRQRQKEDIVRKDSTSHMQVPPELRAFAEQSVEQAKKAFDGFVAATQRAVTTFEDQAAATQAGVKEIQAKAIAYTERNMTTSFDFAQKLLRAKNAEEVMRLHADYVKAQVQTLTEQARELGQTAAQAVAGQRAKAS
jgi:phasin